MFQHLFDIKLPLLRLVLENPMSHTALVSQSSLSCRNVIQIPIKYLIKYIFNHQKSLLPNIADCINDTSPVVRRAAAILLKRIRSGVEKDNSLSQYKMSHLLVR